MSDQVSMRTNKPRVLVCDDDPALLDLMARRLERLGLTTERASGGAEASTRLSQNAYDLLVTDIYMPEVTGLDLLRQIKARDANAQVVVATASATLDSAVEALNHGAFAYLTKPFDHLTVFDNVVTRALEFRRLLLDNIRMAEVQRRRGDMLEEEVTSRIRQLKRRHEYMTDLVGHLPVGVIVFDENARPLLANPVAERILGAEMQDAKALLARLAVSLPAEDGRWSGEFSFAGGSAHATLIELPVDAEKIQRILVLAEEEQASPARGTMVGQALSHLRSGLAWLSRQSLTGDAPKVRRALLTQLHQLEQMTGSGSASPSPLPSESVKRETPTRPSDRHILERGWALLRRPGQPPAPAGKPEGEPAPQPEVFERSLQRWAGKIESESALEGEGGQAGRGVWPPPLPSKVEDEGSPRP
jgi:CheY-like chemotaxis protein